ncbi:MAG: hypothetical protein ACOYI6_04160 [Christensenellales bacterium]
MDGALIERGRVIEKTDTGYRVKSLTRDGITTPPIPAMGGAEHQAGSLVYFFVFGDGHGMILAAFDRT